MEQRDLDIMATIQEQKQKDIEEAELQPLDAEGVRMGEHKRDTIDVKEIPVDPLR